MRIKHTVDISGLKNAPSVFNRHINIAAKKVEGKVIADAIRETPEDQGTARQSFKGFHVVAQFHALVEITNEADHFAVIEDGRGAGKPPPPPGTLLGWMQRKGIDPKAEFAIAKAIGERGLPAHRPLGKSLEKNETFIKSAFDEAIRNGVKQING